MRDGERERARDATRDNERQAREGDMQHTSNQGRVSEGERERDIERETTRGRLWKATRERERDATCVQ